MRHSHFKGFKTAGLRSSFSSCVLLAAIAAAVLAASGPASAAAIVEASVPGDLVTGTSTNSPPNQGPTKAIDNSVTSNYLNFDKLNSGLTITPQGNRPVRALTLICAEDAPERDPSSFVLEGSTDGTNFARIASNAVPVFPSRYFIQSFAVANTSVFNRYRLRFPTIANAATANSMQIAEVELLYHEEISSRNDEVTITLPPGADYMGDYYYLFDRKLGPKLEVVNILNGDTAINVTLAAGAKVLKGFELIGAADDLTYPLRRPSRVTVAGSTDGTTYTEIATVVPAAPSSNLQIQEFATTSNITGFTHYRITFGPPVSGNRLQVGEMRLFGDAAPVVPEIAVYLGNTTNAGAARASGYEYAFPDAAIGHASTTTFTIRNLGGTNLSGLSLSMTGPDVNDYNLSQLNTTSLAPNGTVTFSVNFEPTAEGVRGVSVWIASNDPDENPFEIKIRGTGLSSPAIVDASVPGDLVTGTSGNSPLNQGPTKAIDNNVTSKYLNFDKLNTGLTITPQGNQPVRAITLFNAEDAEERDPSSFVFEGSNDGTNFTRIASNAVPAFVDHHFIQSFAFANTNVFNRYRLRFPTLANAATANSMQIAEVELLHHEELTFSIDGSSITLPPFADDVGSYFNLIDRRLGSKLEVAYDFDFTNVDTVINFDLATEAKVLKGFELIGAADDLTYPLRRPSRVTVAGSTDGTTYTEIATVFPAAPSSNLQIQEFGTTSNTNAFAHYRFILGPSVGGDRLQLGEMRLFGDALPSGWALRFDGTDDYIEVPDAGLSMPTNEITIEFWQRTDEARMQSTFCMSPDQLGNRIACHLPWIDGKVYWDFGNYLGDGRLSYTPPQSLVGTWNHFAFVSSRAGNYQRIYRNGVLEASDNTTMSFTRYAAAFRIGANTVNQFFKGELDEFRIWSVARTPEEIAQNMYGHVNPQTNLWAYWRFDGFDDGIGYIAADYSGNGRYATIYNGAQWVPSTIPGPPPAPVLSIRASGTNALVSWPYNPGFTLEAKTSLSNATWTLVGSMPVLSNGVNTITLPTSGTSSFFRLRK